MHLRIHRNKINSSKVTANVLRKLTPWKLVLRTSGKGDLLIDSWGEGY